MGFRERRLDKAAGKGRILQMRLGINPNSSGHGILWGAIFFLPFSIVLLLVPQVEKSLTLALKQHHTREHDRRLAPGLLLFWLLSWAGFCFLWAYVTVTLDPAQLWLKMNTALITATAAVSIIIVLLYRCRHQQGLPELTRKAALMAVYGTLGAALLLLVTGIPAWLVTLIILIVYLCLSALLLSAGVLKLSGLLRRSMLLAAGIYITVGFLSIVPVIPLPFYSSNPVGLFFILWGPGAPFVAAVAGLLRMGRTACEGPEISS